MHQVIIFVYFCFWSFVEWNILLSKLTQMPEFLSAVKEGRQCKSVKSMQVFAINI